MSSDSKVLGVVLLVRHGDRSSFYQNPSTYTPSQTKITPLGNQQEFQLGSYLRDLYLNETSSSHIQGLSTGLFNSSQVQVRADAGGEGGVIFDSAISLLQGLWPASKDNNVTLANGTTISAPLSGYQYVPIESVEAEQDVTLEGWTSCHTFDTATSKFYNSSAFQAVASEHAGFLQSLPQYLDGRPVKLENMWNIFDFMNVESIYNSDFAKALPPTYLAQARHLANYHEYGVFSSQDISGISNIAGRTIILPILEGFEKIAGKSPVKFVYQAISYKPFLSLFNMTGAAQANPQLASIVNYAAALALEVRQPSSGGEPVIRFNFKNGTDDSQFTAYNFLNGTGDVPLSQFINVMAPAAINSTAEWCDVCSNTADRGCAELQVAKSEGHAEAHNKISPVGAGFLGAGLTIAVFAAMLLVLFFLGLLTFGKRRSRKTSPAEKA